MAGNNRKMALALVQEPYVGNLGRMRDYGGVRIYQCENQGDATVKAAIIVFDQNIQVTHCVDLTTPNIAVVVLKTRAWETVVVSFYLEPDKDIEPYIEHLKKIQERFPRTKMVMGGDANAKSPWWGSDKLDDRGEVLAENIEEMGMHIVNEGVTPTFHTIRGGRELSSIVDITICTQTMVNIVDEWRVEEGTTSSDHNTIVFNLKLQKSTGNLITSTTRIFNTRKADWSEFLETIKEQIDDQLPDIETIDNKIALEQYINKYTEIIKDTSHKTIPLKKNSTRFNLPWWNEELEKLKKQTTTYKRRIRCAAPIRKDKVVGEYLQKKEEYENKAKETQIESWKNFCTKQDKEGMWEGIYRVIGRTTKRKEDQPLVTGGRALSSEESANLLAETFFPKDNPAKDDDKQSEIRELSKKQIENDGTDTDPPFTMKELEIAANSFSAKKAPGSDGLTADICQQAISENPQKFLDMANKCLELGHFPDVWKEATIIVLRKPGKTDYAVPKSYRPIGLLPVLGKIMEKMLMKRIRWHILPKLSSSQYGFVPQKSTEDALYVLMSKIKDEIASKKIVTIISLDIEGAFDNAWWPAILCRLEEAKCPWNLRKMVQSYLTNRKVELRYAGTKITRHTNKGCVQGSIGGPTFWNLLLDPLLKMLNDGGDYCQAFADDIVLVFAGHSGKEIEAKANSALARVRAWGVQNKLNFAPHKTQAMVLTKKLKFDSPCLSMGGVVIPMASEIKILGLTVDNKLTFNAHVANTCRKALGIYQQLSRAAKIQWGLDPEIVRILYLAVVEPIILYAASVWAPATHKLGVQRQLGAVQRGFAQKICGAYRTVSLNAALVLSGILPLDLRIQEAAALFEAKRGLSQEVLGDREMERSVHPTEAPHPAEQIGLEYISLTEREQVEDRVHHSVRIYTDGSKIEGKVGSALSIWRNGTETRALKLKLPSHSTVYQAELLAICEATRFALKCGADSCAILSDSRSALDCVINPESPHPLAVEARAHIRSSRLQNREISLFWIKAHAGLEGNERADELAKEAALKLKTKPNYDACPVSFVKRELRMLSLDKWNQRYQNGSTAGTTKVFFPDAVEAYGVIRKLRPAGVLTQVLSGHGGFSEYLHRFKCKEDPSCFCEPGVSQSIGHLLAECPAFGRERFEAQRILNSDVTAGDFKDLISNPKTRDEFVNYCKYIAEKVIKRNK